MDEKKTLNSHALEWIMSSGHLDFRHDNPNKLSRLRIRTVIMEYKLSVDFKHLKKSLCLLLLNFFWIKYSIKESTYSSVTYQLVFIMHIESFAYYQRRVVSLIKRSVESWINVHNALVVFLHKTFVQKSCKCTSNLKTIFGGEKFLIFYILLVEHNPKWSDILWEITLQ
jgi:hypothetical protein